ncbi:hypothetical protein OURE66S_02109 [Oligella ureolytica]
MGHLYSGRSFLTSKGLAHLEKYMDSIEQHVKGIIAEQLAIKDESEVKNESSFFR